VSADRYARFAVERLDEVAHAMELKWGVDRLPRLVDPALAARFEAQRVKLNEALRSDRPDAIAAQAAAMERAWKALDAAALAAGAKPLSPTVWEAALPSTGEIVAIVRTAEEASAIARDRKGAVYTLAEVAVALDAFGDEVRATKAAFPGATVTAVRQPSLAIGSAPAGSPSAAAAPSHARTRRRPPAKHVGFYPGLFAPLLPSKPIDWERGDDIPF
jgi:hypothetical protein